MSVKQQQYRDAELIIGNPNTARFKKALGGHKSSGNHGQESASGGYFGVATVDVIPNFKNNNNQKCEDEKFVVNSSEVLNLSDTRSSDGFDHSMSSEGQRSHLDSHNVTSEGDRSRVCDTLSRNENIKSTQKLFSCEQDCFIKM